MIALVLVPRMPVIMIALVLVATSSRRKRGALMTTTPSVVLRRVAMIALVLVPRMPVILTSLPTGSSIFLELTVTIGLEPDGMISISFCFKRMWVFNKFWEAIVVTRTMNLR